jgi:hypothetical protein
MHGSGGILWKTATAETEKVFLLSCLLNDTVRIENYIVSDDRMSADCGTVSGKRIGMGY